MLYGRYLLVNVISVSVSTRACFGSMYFLLVLSCILFPVMSSGWRLSRSFELDSGALRCTPAFRCLLGFSIFYTHQLDMIVQWFEEI